MPSRVIGSPARQVALFRKGARKVIQKELTAIGQDEIRYLNKVTDDWVNKPRFRILVTIRPTMIGYDIIAPGKEGEIFGYVDEGTRPHIIRPKRPGYPLAFQGGYSPKTAPIAKYAVGTGQANGAWVKTYVVLHPGNEAREFKKQWFRENKREISRRLNNALRRALRRAQ